MYLRQRGQKMRSLRDYSVGHSLEVAGYIEAYARTGACGRVRRHLSPPLGRDLEVVVVVRKRTSVTIRERDMNQPGDSDVITPPYIPKQTTRIFRCFEFSPPSQHYSLLLLTIKRSLLAVSPFPSLTSSQFSCISFNIPSHTVRWSTMAQSRYLYKHKIGIPEQREPERSFPAKAKAIP